VFAALLAWYFRAADPRAAQRLRSRRRGDLAPRFGDTPAPAATSWPNWATTSTA
jgi:hypothetical protein